MTDTSALISVENVSRRFALRGGAAGDLRERFASWRRRRGPDAPRREDADFWALRDVSFEVRPGEPVGLIGHNGSGKSTMLKIVNGILPPTHGTSRVRGRVGALIEVGAGFHPDLSGRENVYLNGAILGLSRREIARKFDAIVAFADLEKFIDTPVKRYSSGMYMRLGFAVAAHTDPEILLIDEVLAVGDALFQNKCLRHLKEFVAGGGSVLFVSHAANQVAELCQTCVWLDHGRVRAVGPARETLDAYMAVVAEREQEEWRRTHPEEWARQEAERASAEAEAERERAERAARRADPSRTQILGCRVVGRDGRELPSVAVTEPVTVQIHYRMGRRLPFPVFCLEIFRDDGMYMFATNSYLHDLPAKSLPLEGVVAMDVPAMTLNEGEYYVNLHLFPDCTGDDFYLRFPCEDKVEKAARFRVEGGRLGGYGCAYLPVTWRVEETAAAAAVVQAAPSHKETVSAPG